MRMSMGLQARQLQTQKLAPRMIQSMEILQLHALALKERIEQEMEDNPVLDRIEPTEEVPNSEDQTNPDAPTESERKLVVNDDIITYGEYEAALRNMKSKLEAAGEQVPEEKILKEQVLEQLVYEKLLQLHAVDTGINVTDAMVDQAMENLAPSL